MSDSVADRNLLFGILALQNNFIDREMLLTAFTAWVVDKRRPLGEILRQQGKLTQLQDELLRALTEQHIKQHGNDPQQSLAAVSAVGSIHDDLRKLGDPQLELSLAGVAQQPATADTFSRGTASTCDWGGETLRFRILRPHRKGGLGQVFVAQDLELHREVALKEIQSQFADHPDSRSRFVLEAEITGGLEHPGIVPVYGFGQYADGRPFYAMRFIRGDSLKDAIECFHKFDAAGRSPGERTLELRKLLGRFIDVCEAIEYAHSRGVLHRDLKPGNIMLGKYGETLVVDWGLAKSVGRGEQSSATGETTLRPSSGESVDPTILGKTVGTPAFMSPEQAAGRLNELGPASDVYSLGATLYCLLTGQLPFAGNDQGEILRSVERGDFPRPRQVKPQIPAALQATCLKAMALKPNDRYPAPKMLADDIEHWLAGEPVTCYREPALVRARRWVKRHPTLVAATAATVLVSLVSLAAIASVVGHSNRSLTAKNLELDAKNIQLDHANTQLNQTNQLLETTNQKLAASNEQEIVARRRAEEGEAAARRSAEEAQAVFEFFRATVIAAAGPKGENGGLGYNVTVRAALDAAEPQVSKSFADQPLVEAQIRSSLASTYFQLGEFQLAVQQYDRAYELRKANLGAQHNDTLNAMMNLGLSLRNLGKFERALPLLEEVVKLRKATQGLDHATTLAAMLNLGSAYSMVGKFDLAIPMLKETLALAETEYGLEDLITIKTMRALGLAYRSNNNHQQALVLQEQALKLLMAKYGGKHPETLKEMYTLALAYETSGQGDRALQLLAETLLLMDEVLGSNHVSTLQTKETLARRYLEARRIEEALPLLEQCVTAWRRQSVDDELLFASRLLSVSDYLGRGRQYAAAEPYIRECVAIRERLIPEDWVFFNAKSYLGQVLLRQQKFDEAEPLLLDGFHGLQDRVAMIPESNKNQLPKAVQRLIDLYVRWNKPGEAEKWKSVLENSTSTID